jgi:methyl-accepting chemotaxis protein
MLFPLVIVGGCLYYLVFTLLAEQLGIPESIAYNLFPVIEKINIILLIGIPPIVVVLLLWGIFLSHKFLGPLERLEREIHRIAESRDCTKRLRVRRSDAIKPIADAINRLLDSVEKKR